MSEATASIRGYEHDSPHGFACIDQHRRDFPVCIIEFENKSDESPFFLFTTFNFRLPASSRMVATSSPYWVNHDGRLLHSVLWRSDRQRGDVKVCYQPSERQHSRFTLPQMLSLAPLPLIAAAAWVGTLRSVSGQHDWAPPVCAILLFLTSLGGLGARMSGRTPFLAS